MARFWLDLRLDPVAHVVDSATMQAATNKTRLILFAAAALALASCCYWQCQISDAHRLSLFRAHKAEYESVLNMLQHDRDLTFINSTLTVPEDPSLRGISPQRISEYRRYMSKIGCGSINYVPLTGSALFVSDISGAADILYFPVQSSGKPPAQAHPIEGNWYLASERFR